MNVEEAKTARARLISKRFNLRLGMLCGSVVTLIILDFSFIRPHLDFILDIAVLPVIAVSGYLLYLIRKINKIQGILQTSEDTTT